MSKPLTDEQRESVFDDIVKSIGYIHRPAPGEFTLQMLQEALSDAGYDISIGKIRHRLYKLEAAGIISKREIIVSKSRTDVYFPVKDIPMEEMVKILLDV
jgi:hypothetical protein